MLTKVSRQLLSSGKAYSTGKFNVAVLGAAGGIGQPLSLLMKQCDLIKELSLYDVINTPGVAADLSHINTPAKIRGGFKGPDQLGDALKGMNVVLIPAGVPRKPGMTRDDLFNTNATIVQTLAAGCAKYCPEACILVIANPVNSTVPIVAETLRKNSVYNPKRLFGVTTLDICRAATFVAEKKGWNVRETSVTVIGGHAGTTILPLLSQINNANFSEEELKALTKRIQFGGDEVVEAKDGAGSATLSMAVAAADFANALMRGMSGEKNVVQCTYTENKITKLPFFSTPTLLGPEGVQEHKEYGILSALEKQNFDTMLPDLEAQIAKGVAFAKK